MEHVFWNKGGNPYLVVKNDSKDIVIPKGKTVIGKKLKTLDIERLPESYVPPIISILPQVAINDEALIEASK